MSAPPQKSAANSIITCRSQKMPFCHDNSLAGTTSASLMRRVHQAVLTPPFRLITDAINIQSKKYTSVCLSSIHHTVFSKVALFCVCCWKRSTNRANKDVRAHVWSEMADLRLLQASPVSSAYRQYITLLRTPKPRRLIAPSLRSGSGGLNLMLFLFNTPSDAVTITASPTADGQQSLSRAADMQKPKQNIAQLADTNACETGW